MRLWELLIYRYSERAGLVRESLLGGPEVRPT